MSIRRGMRLRSIAVHAFLFAFFVNGALADFNPVNRPDARLGEVANGASTFAGIASADGGNELVFASDASNYVPNDDNGASDVFVLDRATNDVERISVATNEVEGNGASGCPDISSNGQLVVFESAATDLIGSDDNAFKDIFLRDRTAGTTVRISEGNVGQEPDGDSHCPVISDDGSVIAFVSDATNLVSGDSNGNSDIFVHVVATGVTTRIDKTDNAAEPDGDASAPALSMNGQFVAFASAATNHVGLDNNDSIDVFVFDRVADTLTRVSVDSTNAETNGDSGNPSISDDGDFVAFDSLGEDLVAGDGNSASDVFVRQVSTGMTEIVSVELNGVEGNGASSHPSIGGVGRYVAFQSDADNLVSADNNGATDVFVYDRTNDDIARVSVTQTGSEAEGTSTHPALNGNANFTAFLSDAMNIVPDDASGLAEPFAINNQCLVVPDGVMPLDSDADGTDDCNDECATDPGKLLPGVCGCGIADADTDGDGTLDCNDGCPTDSAKSSEGSCGCGVSDADTTGTGLPDCLDPMAGTVPPQGFVKFPKKQAPNAVLHIPKQYNKVKYKYIVKSGGQVVLKKTTKKRKLSVRLGRGKYNFRYKIQIPGGGGFTKASPGEKFQVN